MHDPAYADLHVHTHLSPCGKAEATAAAMVRRALDKGLAALGFADHYTPAPVPGCPFYAEQRLHIVGALRAEIEQLDEVRGLTLLVGVEADFTLAREGCLDREALRQVDHVVCASSHFHLPAAPQPADDSPRSKATLMLDMARAALGVGGISIWAHPFDCSRMRPLRPILATVEEDEFGELIDLANAHQVAIEVNGGPAQYADYRQATAPFYHLARDMGARFTVTSDAHHPDDLDRLDLAWSWARELGLRSTDLLTAEELVERQRSKQ
jgi:histidinol phosphatase-like PHP family hydrolase